MPPNDARTVVSIQRPGATNRIQGHLGPGLLGAPSLVIVPAWAMAHAPHAVDVLIGPGPGGKGPYELIRATFLPNFRRSAVHVEGHAKTLALVFLELEHPSSHPTVPVQVKELSVADHGSGPWRGLSAMIPEDLRELPDKQWLQAGDVAAQPELDLGVRLEAFEGIICFLLRRCGGDLQY
jgi:hypothetical protein